MNRDSKKQFGLTEAAKDILDNNVSSKRSGQEHGVGDTKLGGTVAYGTHEAGLVGQSPEEKDDEIPNYLKGVPTATPPGATPPVGSEKDGVGYSMPKGQPQETMGRRDLLNTTQSPAYDYSAIRDRIAGKLAPQTMQKNPGANFCVYGEEYTLEEITNILNSDELNEDDKEEFVRNVSNRYERDTKRGSDKHTGRLTKKEIGNVVKKYTKGNVSEDIEAMVSGENLSEEWKERASLIFESAVESRVTGIMEDVYDRIESELNEAIESVKEELSDKVDDYLNYMVEEWVKENNIAITTGLRAEVVEDFIQGLHTLFTEHYIDIPEDKVDIVEGLTNKVEELEEILDEQILSSIELKKELFEHKKTEAFYAVCEGLTQTQFEKMKSLAESVEFISEDDFLEKLETIKESYFKAPKNLKSSVFNDEIEFEDNNKGVVTSTDPEIGYYVKTISQTLTK